MANQDMESRVKNELAGQKPSEVTELILDNCRSTTMVGITEEYVELEVLSVINVGLTTLQGFPSLPKLRSLELSDNKISGDFGCLKSCPNLVSLKLCNNKITDLASLEPLKEFTKLASLDLLECPIASEENYRDDVLKYLSQLVYLDGIDREGNAEPDSDEDYEFDEEEAEGDSGVSGEEDGDDDEGDEDDEEDEEDEGEEDQEAKEEDSATVNTNGEDSSDVPPAKRAKLDDASDLSNGATEIES